MTGAVQQGAADRDGLERVVLVAIKAGAALVFVAPLLVMSEPLPDTFFPFIVGKALYIRTLAQIVFAMWLVLALRNPSYRLPRSWLIPLLAVYATVTLLASMFGVSPQRSLWSTYERMQGFVDLVHWLMFVMVLVSVFRSWVDWRALLNFNLAVSGVMSLLGLTQQFEFGVLDYLKATQRLDITLGNPTYVGAYMMVNALIAAAFLGHSWASQGPSRAPRPQERRRRRSKGRSARPASDSTPDLWLVALQIAILLTLVALFITESSGAFTILVIEVIGMGAIYFIWPKPRQAWWRVFWLSVLVLDVSIMYQSGTRGALIGLAAGLLAFGGGYTLWGKLPRVRLTAMVLMIALLGLTVLLGAVRDTGWFEDLARHNVMLNRISIIGDANDSLQGRVDSAITGLRAFADRPLLGWGPENFAIAYDRHVTPEVVSAGVTSFDQAHNKPIEELTTKGILGLASYMSLWVFMLWVLINTVRKLGPADQIFVLFAAAALVGYFVQNLFLFDTPGTVPNYFLLLGFMVFVDKGTVAREVPEATSKGQTTRLQGIASGRLRAVQSELGFSMALASAALVLFVSLYFLSYRPYHAANNVLGAFRPNVSWSERFDLYDESIHAFPPLANYFRISLFQAIANGWGSLSEEETKAALALTDAEGQDAIDGEPEEWRVYFMQAVVNQLASSRSPEALARSRELVDTAVELAPMRVEVNRLLVRHLLIERDLAGAKEALDSYLSLNPNAERHFAPLRSQIESATKGSTSSSRLTGR